MQQWKNKLMQEESAGDAAAVNGPDDDTASNYSGARSNYSRRSKGSDSPFLNISKQQTQKLLKGAP